MVKYGLLFLISLFPGLCHSQKVNSFTREADRVCITLAEGTLCIYPLQDHVIRIRYAKEELAKLPELVFLPGNPIPEFSLSDSPLKLEVRTKALVVTIDKNTGRLTFADISGNPFLNEEAGSRKLMPDTILGTPCYKAELSFESPADESIFGLGQFQDGHYNLRGVSRRLTQVNSQIAIPFIYSSRGYGLLWHQYGLTDYNPADNPIALKKQELSEPGNDQVAEVTSTSGTQKVSQNQSFYKGRFTVPQDGIYSIFLDLGDMGNRHFAVIDGKPCLDQSNMWLPPTAGTLVHLTAGEHQVQLVCKSDNQPSLTWKLKDDYTTFRSPHAKMIDYVVFYGPSADTVIASYRNLTGNAPLFPLWAYGFWQCRERYTSATHLIETVKEFRNRKLPVDVIVQDWQYWGSRGWGVPQFDEKNYPDPPVFIKELHDLHAHFNISIWSNPDKNSEIGKEYVARERFVPGTKWLDYFNPETRKEYWTTLNENMFVHGVDSWWMDAVEPENDALKGERTYMGPGDFYRLTYPLMVSKAVYEGQRETTDQKRVCILTRSAFLGQQRYGVINWSGDIGGDWDTYRRQIVAGLNYTITGLPYWTTDIGGFFRPGRAQYTDEKYHELLMRWYQWSVFNPVFRMHGYMSETEPWKFGKQVEDNMRMMLNLRYRLIPYIYSEAWQVTHYGSTMMRPMIMDFRGDTAAVNSMYQFMFGKAVLVAPVTKPGIADQEVYLPKSTVWYDFWTGERFEGGRTIKTRITPEQIPVFVKGGSILPLGKLVQYTTEKPADTMEIRIYRGANGTFTLYEDENDNYNYEKGMYAEIQFVWNDAKRELTIGDRRGSFPEMLEKRIFNIVVVAADRGYGISVCRKPDKWVYYS
jgi:alpha-D-xyloside xylohydrolase